MLLLGVRLSVRVCAKTSTVNDYHKMDCGSHHPAAFDGCGPSGALDPLSQA